MKAKHQSPDAKKFRMDSQVATKVVGNLISQTQHSKFLGSVALETKWQHGGYESRFPAQPSPYSSPTVVISTHACSVPKLLCCALTTFCRIFSMRHVASSSSSLLSRNASNFVTEAYLCPFFLFVCSRTFEHCIQVSVSFRALPATVPRDYLFSHKRIDCFIFCRDFLLTFSFRVLSDV